MNRQFFKVFVMTLISFALLYYGAAWAVLRCCHEKSHSSLSVFFNSVNPVDSSSPELSCLELVYHTESMAQPSSASRLHFLIDGLRMSSVDSLTSQWVLQHDQSALWPRAVFERFPSFSFLIGLPRYLSLSILRI